MGDNSENFGPSKPKKYCKDLFSDSGYQLACPEIHKISFSVISRLSFSPIPLWSPFKIIIRWSHTLYNGNFRLHRVGQVFLIRTREISHRSELPIITMSKIPCSALLGEGMLHLQFP